MKIPSSMLLRTFLIIFILVSISLSSAISQELRVKIGDEKGTVINKLGFPKKTRRFERGGERLFYNDLSADIHDNKLWGVHSKAKFKGTIFSVRLGDSIYRVNKLLGTPDEADENRLVYYNINSHYLRFDLNRKRKIGTVGAIFIRPGMSKETVEKQKMMEAKLIERGIITTDAERRSNLKRKMAHERITERDYKKKRSASRQLSTEYYTITGKLKKKNSAFSPVEKSHEIEKRMKKFIVEYKTKEDGVIKIIQQKCFIDKYVTSLRNKLSSLSIGDMITIRGRAKYIEDRIKTKMRGMDIENQMSLSIFLVDRIE